MAKPGGALCNLGCQYCFFLPKASLYPGSLFRMTEEVLEAYIRQTIQSQLTPAVTFAWQGGEPTLMGLDFYRKAITLQEKYRRPGQTIQNAFQTNGVLVDDAWGAFFQEHHFLVGISLDGPRELHDAFRKDKGGHPTFDRVIAGLRVLQKFHVEYNLLTCVHAANADHPLETYRFFRDDAGAKYLQFIPIVQRENPAGFQEGSRLTARSVTGRQYGRFLIEIFDEWIRRDVGNVFVQIFDVALACWLGEPSGLCVFDETCGQCLALEHTGDLYSCDHFVEPRHLLGNILETPLADLAASKPQQRFGKAKRDRLPRACTECKVRFACNGGCPKDRILRTPQGEPGLNWLCEGYLDFFTHIDETMKMMSMLVRMGQPAAGVMGLIGERGAPVETKKTPARKRRRK